MSDDAKDFYLPNIHNLIESAKYQIVRGNHALAIEFLNQAQKSVKKIKSEGRGNGGNSHTMLNVR